MSKEQNAKKFDKKLKYGMLSLVILLAVIAGVVFINLIFDMIFGIAGMDLKLDLTQEKKYTISKESEKVIKDIKLDVDVYCLLSEFDADKGNNNQAYDFVKRYGKYDRVKVHFVDPNKNPKLLSEIDPDNTLGSVNGGEIVVKSDKRLRLVSAASFYSQDGSQLLVENYITNAIQYVAQEKVPEIYFLKEEGEKTISSELSMMKDFTEPLGYVFNELALNDKTEIPEEVEYIAIVAPQRDISKESMDKIIKFFKRGGDALFLFDVVTGGVEEKFDNFQQLLNLYNVELGYNIVEEHKAEKHAADNYLKMYADLGESEIHKYFRMDNLNEMVVDESRTVNILKNDKSYIEVEELVKTSDESKAKSRLADGKDVDGPHTLGVGVINKGYSANSKLIVMGDSTFVDGMNMRDYGGMYFIAGSLAWLTEKPEETYVSPKLLGEEKAVLTQKDHLIITIITIIVLPIIIFGLGIFIWIRRRNL